MKRVRVLVALVGVSIGSTASAADLPRPSPAATGAAPAKPSDWALQITPYVWASGLSGRFSPFRLVPTMHVKKSFADVMGDFNLGGFLHVWGRKGSLVLGGDFMYVSTTDSRSVDPAPIVGAIHGRLTTGLFYASLLGGYRLLDAKGITVDLLSGARVWSVSNRASVDVGPIALGYNKSFAWVDPLVGARVFWGLTDKFSVQAQGDIGGFGAGSKLTWHGVGTLNYALADHLSASVGYKILKVDYERNGYVFDVTMSGPVIGLTYRF